MPKTSLDAIDRKILKYLIKNARMPFLEIARECGISGAAIHQRIRKLRRFGGDSGKPADRRSQDDGFRRLRSDRYYVKDPQFMMQTVEKLKEIPEIVECALHHRIRATFS